MLYMCTTASKHINNKHQCRKETQLYQTVRYTRAVYGQTCGACLLQP